MADKEATKLGPSATYLGNHDGDRQSVTMAGVFFRPGESVNLIEQLGNQRGQAMINKLAGNTFFKVDGGPDHRDAAEKRGEALERQEEAHSQEQADARRAKEEEEARIAAINAPDEATLEKPANGRSGRRQAT